MRKTLSALAVAFTAHAASAADGLITFLYFAQGPGDIPITFIGSGAPSPATADDRYTVGLYAGNQVGNLAAIPLATVRIFQSTGLFQYQGGDVTIPGSTPGQRAVLTLKIWDGSSFTSPDTKVRAETSFTSEPLGGPNPNPPPPAFTAPDLSSPSRSFGFHGGPFVIGIFPEPSTYVFTILGLAALALAHRRKQV